MSNIVETATNAGSFTTLVAAVQAAGLGATLSGRRPVDTLSEFAAPIKIPVRSRRQLCKVDAVVRRDEAWDPGLEGRIKQ